MCVLCIRRTYLPSLLNINHKPLRSFMKGFVFFVLAIVGLSAIGAALAYRIPTEKIVEKPIEKPVEKTVIVDQYFGHFL